MDQNRPAMCFHTALAAPIGTIAKRYGRQSDLFADFKPIYRVSAFSHAETPDGQIQRFRWGLIPFWTHDFEDALVIHNRTINARSETVFTKPSFREPIRKKRCLIPATGFFDWRHENEAGGKIEKIPFFISVTDEPIFSFAGIYDEWHNKATDEKVYTYSILTTGANDMMRYIHNTNMRMPVILRPDEEQKWLDPALTEQQINSFFQPLGSRAMASHVIGNDFLKKSPFDPSILAEDRDLARSLTVQ